MKQSKCEKESIKTAMHQSNPSFTVSKYHMFLAILPMSYTFACVLNLNEGCNMHIPVVSKSGKALK